MIEPLPDVAPAFHLLGKRWNGLLLSVLMRGPAGYAELKRSVPGIGDSGLSGRLAERTEAGLCERAVSAGPPVAVTYRLTSSGRALGPAFEALTTWAAQYLRATPSRQ
jgi:DNA-binding HxlR family transcriptional regulator